MSEQKFRQWWVDPSDELEQDAMDLPPVYMALHEHPGQGPLLWQASLIHVIDYAAYKIAVDALKAECGNRCAHQNPCSARDALEKLGEV